MLRAFQWDLARQVERLDWLLEQLPRYAEWGYNELYLHLEDAVEYPSLPGVARKDAYSYRQMLRLVRTAERVGIKTVPIVNLLGHTQYLIKVPELRELNELREADGAPAARGQICPVHPRTLAVADALLRDVTPFCTAGKVHVGLDESFHLGKHPLSRKEIQRIGLPAHFARYVHRLRDLTRARGLAMGLWADMLYFLPEAIPLLPADVAAYEWYYYGFGRRPRVELFNFAESDVGERLSARGIEYWGCPMNGAFRFEPLPHFHDRLENILSWWKRCHRLNAAGFLMTSWEPYRLAIELTTVIDAAAASLWLDDIEDPRAMLERGFARVFGRKRTVAARTRADTARRTRQAPPAYAAQYSPGERARARNAARLALAADRFPFSGYPRWEIATRWDVVSRREPVAPYREEARHFAALNQKAKTQRAPEPLTASLALRLYLAVRDVWVREALARGDVDPLVAAAIRRAVRDGLRAAQTPWRRTRSRRTIGPNEQIIVADAERYENALKGAIAIGPGWQLCYRVENFAPAAQLVAVEQQRSDGRWETRQACHTIEFQGAAARPRGGFVREHAAPVEWPEDRGEPPQLRFVLRGLGQVKVSSIVLTDGRRQLIPSAKVIPLGRPAPKRGFPNLDWTENRAVAPLTFTSRRDRRPT